MEFVQISIQEDHVEICQSIPTLLNVNFQTFNILVNGQSLDELFAIKTPSGQVLFVRQMATSPQPTYHVVWQGKA